LGEGVDEIHAIGLSVLPSRVVSVPGIRECRAIPECVRHQVINDFGDDSLIIGRVVAARLDAGLAPPTPDVLEANPILVYVHPNHHAVIGSALRFDFPHNYKP
jgi:flavin reductase (DIM6/NTAB) family NADH-FMN oxidoreductase RutF